MKKISLDEFLRLRKLVHRSARPLDYTKWRFLFENGSCDDFLLVLSGYQNEHGGFGHNIECNNWNPNSSPYTVCIALDYLDATGNYESGIKSKIIAGIVKYLSSGAYLLNDGWLGMQGIPGNNDFAHMPWFHFDFGKAAEADIGVTKRLADFILKHADKNSSIYCKSESLKDRYRKCGQVLLNGYPDYDPTALNIKAYDPATYPTWLPNEKKTEQGHDQPAFFFLSGLKGFGRSASDEIKGEAYMVRQADKQDIPRIAEIIVFGKRVAYRPIFENDYVSFHELQVVRLYEEYKNNPDRLDGMLLYDDGIVKGVINGHPVDDKTIEITDFYVDPFFVRQGIGTLLIEYLIQQVRKKGVNKIVLWVIKDNVKARKFYEAREFVNSGKTCIIEGTTKEDCLYEYVLE